MERMHISYYSLTKPIFTIIRENSKSGDVQGWNILIGAYKKNNLINFHKKYGWMDERGNLIDTTDYNDDIMPLKRVYIQRNLHDKDNYIYMWLKSSLNLDEIIYICYKIQNFIKEYTNA